MQDPSSHEFQSALEETGLAKHPAKRKLIRVVAPAGPVDAGALEAGLAVLRGRGFEVVPGSHVLDRNGYLAGGDDCRLADLQEALDDESAEIVWFARGGYGTSRILPGLRWNEDRPAKIVAGYSDATVFHLWAQRFGNMRCLYAPSVTELGRPGVAVLSSLWAALQGEFEPVPGDGPATPAGPFDITGGCLTLCCASAGTFWAPETEGRWVFLEEVGEKLYRIDRMFTHLQQAGWFGGCAGVLLGAFTGLGEGETAAMVRERVEYLAGPEAIVVASLPVGHVTGKQTIPLGVPALWDGRFVRFGGASGEPRGRLLP